MSKLLKSKFFFGVMIVAVMLVVGATTASAAYMHMGTLKMGMRSAQVTELQATLGVTPMSGYFGPITKAAVMAFQAANGLTADGIVGAMTGAKLSGAVSGGTYPAGCTSSAGYSSTTGMPCTGGSSLPAGCTSTAGYSPTTGAKCDGASTGGSTGPLTGGAGSITVDGTSDFTSEEVGEGEEDVEVLGFEVEADDESDVEITSIKVEFVQGTGADSEDLSDYAESVAIWMGSTKIGEADAEDFSENSDVYTKSISVDGAVVRAGDTEEFSVSVTALNNLDSGDIDTDAWTVDVLNVRFEDADGVVTTEDTDAEALEQSFDFSDFASAANLEVKISLSDEDDVNEAHVINVDANDDTDDVEVLSFEVEADGNSDVLVKELPIVVTTVGMNVLDGISRVTLWADGEEIGSESTVDDDTSDDITFQDLDYTIDAGDTVVFTVAVDINDLDATAGSEVAEGDTIQVSVGADAAWDLEDETGESVGTGDITGTADADAHGIYDVGIMAEFKRATATATPSGVATVDDTGTFKIYFDVTAFDSDIYVDGTAIADETGGATYQDIDASTTSVGAGVIECSSCSTAANTTFEVKEGQTREFVVTVAGSGADIFASASLTSILYATTPIDGDTLYTFNMADYKTDSVWLDSN